MSGTKAGGLKAAATNKKRTGDDFYARIGAKGGRNGHTGGFAADRELARVAGAKGGRKSRRNGVKNGEGKTVKKTKKITPKTTPRVKKILENHELGLEYEPMKTEPYVPERVILPETKKRGLFNRIFRRNNA